jgi:hypothetical protein
VGFRFGVFRRLEAVSCKGVGFISLGFGLQGSGLRVESFGFDVLLLQRSRKGRASGNSKV